MDESFQNLHALSFMKVGVYGILVLVLDLEPFLTQVGYNLTGAHIGVKSPPHPVCVFFFSFQHKLSWCVKWTDPPFGKMSFLRSPERDLTEVTVGANKRLVGPPDISTAISMPVKMLLALCNRIIAVHGLIGQLQWPHDVIADHCRAKHLTADVFSETLPCLKEWLCACYSSILVFCYSSPSIFLYLKFHHDLREVWQL